MNAIDSKLIKVTCKKEEAEFHYFAHFKGAVIAGRVLIRTSRKAVPFALAHFYPENNVGSAGGYDRVGNHFTFTNENGKPQRNGIGSKVVRGNLKYEYKDYPGVQTVKIEMEAGAE